MTTTSPDLTIGAFTDRGPWVVDPDDMPWRTGIDELRAKTQAMVPSLIDPKRAPAVRLAHVGAVLAATIGPWTVRKKLKREATTAELARGIRGAFERLGTTYIKLGQIIASADGMLPAELVQEFKSCRDQVPPEPFETVRRVVEGDLGRTIEEIFERFDPHPIAAASIAQVHAARLRTGEDVVVKVQRPSVAKVVPEDLRTMAWLAPILAKRAPQLKFVNLPAYVELFAETLVEELDFRLEAQNMLDIAAVLALTEQRAVVVPRPHPELVTPRVLVMERLQGFKIDDDAGMRDAGIDPNVVFTSLTVSFFEGAGIYGVFHGDLHGGNMMVLPDGKAGLFDFGITGRFDDAARTALMQLLLGGLTQDIEDQIRSFRDLGGFPPDVDVSAIAREIDIERLRAEMNLAEMSSEQMAAQMRELVNQLLDHGGKLPKSLFLFLKGMIYLSGATAALAADVDILGTIVELFTYFAETHGDVFAAEFGVDIRALDIDTLMQEQLAQVSEQAGVDLTGGFSFREITELQQQRMEELRQAKKG